MNNRYYASFSSESMPLYFKKINPELVDEENGLIFKNIENKEQWEIDGKPVDYKKYAIKIKEDKWFDQKSILRLFFGSFLIMFLNTLICLFYIYGYSNPFNINTFVILTEILISLWVFYWASISSLSNKIVDFIVMLILGLPMLSVLVYGLLFRESVLVITSILLLINAVVFLETVKSVLAIKYSGQYKTFKYGNQIEFLLIRG